MTTFADLFKCYKCHSLHSDSLFSLRCRIMVQHYRSELSVVLRVLTGMWNVSGACGGLILETTGLMHAKTHWYSLVSSDFKMVLKVTITSQQKWKGQISWLAPHEPKHQTRVSSRLPS